MSSTSNSNVPKIEDSFEKLEEYPSVNERYYKCFYYKSNAAKPADHCILWHSNKICLITLAPTHPIVQERKKINYLDFQVSDKVDRLENRVVGRSKKGAQFIKPDSVLCFVECHDGTRYAIYGCVHGKLIEVNERLADNYKLLWDKPLTEGYIAIILPTKKDFDPSTSSRKDKDLKMTIMISEEDQREMVSVKLKEASLAEATPSRSHTVQWVADDDE